jgi:hypothetical protein
MDARCFSIVITNHNYYISSKTKVTCSDSGRDGRGVVQSCGVIDILIPAYRRTVVIRRIGAACGRD